MLDTIIHTAQKLFQQGSESHLSALLITKVACCRFQYTALPARRETANHIFQQLWPIIQHHLHSPVGDTELSLAGDALNGAMRPSPPISVLTEPAPVLTALIAALQSCNGMGDLKSRPPLLRAARALLSTHFKLVASRLRGRPQHGDFVRYMDESPAAELVQAALAVLSELSANQSRLAAEAAMIAFACLRQVISPTVRGTPAFACAAQLAQLAPTLLGACVDAIGGALGHGDDAFLYSLERFFGNADELYLTAAQDLIGSLLLATGTEVAVSWVQAAMSSAQEAVKRLASFEWSESTSTVYLGLTALGVASKIACKSSESGDTSLSSALSASLPHLLQFIEWLLNSASCLHPLVVGRACWALSFAIKMPGFFQGESGPATLLYAALPAISTARTAGESAQLRKLVEAVISLVDLPPHAASLLATTVLTKLSRLSPCQPEYEELVPLLSEGLAACEDDALLSTSIQKMTDTVLPLWKARQLDDDLVSSTCSVISASGVAVQGREIPLGAVGELVELASLVLREPDNGSIWGETFFLLEQLLVSSPSLQLVREATRCLGVLADPAHSEQIPEAIGFAVSLAHAAGRLSAHEYLSPALLQMLSLPPSESDSIFLARLMAARLLTPVTTADGVLLHPSEDVALLADRVLTVSTALPVTHHNYASAAQAIISDTELCLAAIATLGMDRAVTGGGPQRAARVRSALVLWKHLLDPNGESQQAQLFNRVSGCALHACVHWGGWQMGQSPGPDDILSAVRRLVLSEDILVTLDTPSLPRDLSRADQTGVQGLPLQALSTRSELSVFDPLGEDVEEGFVFSPFFCSAGYSATRVPGASASTICRQALHAGGDLSNYITQGLTPPE
eukprot:gnl/Dysnectes_brevis/1651_a1878_1015.p1 GENE.gnl/Dysnectes_brevis/1651_a1878_1015~~gnl/Dysnectes_brevis/1651_a1878_1015.p1  ORF type:complete len:993 (+),score=282.44 gnl/Dysnectes_brevis/1651_a1878_1015:411-2981(+)